MMLQDVNRNWKGYIMKINPLFVLREIADEYIVIPVGEETEHVKGILYLNYEGAFLWKMLKDDQTEDSLVRALTEKFNVEDAVARHDISDFLAELNRIGCIL